MSEALPVVEETVVQLVIGAEVAYEWRCTPHDLEALAAGRLFVDGRVIQAANLSIVSGDVITMTLRETARGRLDTGGSTAPALPEADAFHDLFRALFAGVDERYEHGGMHAAALTDGRSIIYQAEDVGRHNAVDKVIGMAVLGDSDLAAHGLLVSARVSGEIARKAAESGVAWLASRSIPTTLAVRIAGAAGLPIIGRAASRNAFVYR
jgi:formate dehydrogenase assembly factor FdhD